MTDWRGALDIYVAGRNRSLTIDEKRTVAQGIGRPEAPNSSPDPIEVPPAGRVSVPAVLSYYRNAGTWRRRVDAPDSGAVGNG